MEWIHLDQNSVTCLTEFILDVVITVFILQVKGKSKATLYLAAFMGAFSVFFVDIFFLTSVVQSWYYFFLPNLFVGNLLFLLFLLQFAYHFPQLYCPREARYVMIISIIGLVSLSGVSIHFLVVLFQTQTYLTSELSFISLLSPLEFLWAISVLARQTVTSSRLYQKAQTRLPNSTTPLLPDPTIPKHSTKLYGSFWSNLVKPQGKQAQATRAFALVICTPLLLTFLATLDGLAVIDANAFFLLMALGLLLFVFCLIIVYLNNSLEPTTLRVKIVLSTLVTVLALLNVEAYVVAPYNEKAFDTERLLNVEQVHRAIATINLSQNKFDQTTLPPSVLYIVARQLSADMDATAYTTVFTRETSFDLAIFPRFNFNPSPTLRNNNAGQNLPNERQRYYRFPASILEPRHYVVYFFPEADKRYEVGFSADTYFSFVNQRGLNLIFLVLGATLMILVVFPLFFRSNLIKPLETLLLGVKQFEVGKFQAEDLTTVATRSDELGQMARVFQHMALEIKNYTVHLEELVASRTVQLEQANHEISTLNLRLEAENSRMANELEITRRIQKLILPKDEELARVPGLDIASYIQPADDVGGDYFDVLQLPDGRVKIGIGDVTGHGLESGMVMMMVQMGVRTLLTYNETDPIRLLNALNQAIFENVKRMESDKNLTLMLLDYQDGKMRLSGQHESLLIARACAEIEVIDTMSLGFPVGLEPDISSFIAYTDLQLNQDDVVVLYTDGITEAQNLERKQYGLGRLCQVIQANQQDTARQIKDAIINDVLLFIGIQKIFDDMTLLVVKQR